MSGNNKCSCSVQYSSNLNESKTATAQMHRLYPYLLQLTADTEKAARPREAKDLSKPIEKAAQTHSVSMNGALAAVRDGEMMCSLRGLDGHSRARWGRMREEGVTPQILHSSLLFQWRGFRSRMSARIGGSCKRGWVVNKKKLGRVR